MSTVQFRRLILLLLLVGVALCAAPLARADSPPLGPIPPEASGPAIDPAAATRAYLATIPADAKARSDAYFEGGYWLLLWNALLGVGISILVLATGWSAAWRDRTARFVRWRWVQVAPVRGDFTLVSTLLGFPLTVYQLYFREHQYNMATQNFGAWFAEQGTGLVVQVILSAIFLPVLYAVFRRSPRQWWLWGSLVTIAFTAIATVIAPIFIAPLFNKYKPLEDAAIREPILAMARANQIPVNNVYEFDASRQTTRVSANVSGLRLPRASTSTTISSSAAPCRKSGRSWRTRWAITCSTTFTSCSWN